MDPDSTKPPDLPADALRLISERLTRVESILSSLVAGAAIPPYGHLPVPPRPLVGVGSMLRRDDTGHITTPYLDAHGAASYLGISLGSLYGIVERRHLTPLRGPRRRYRFTTALLDEYLGRKGGAR